MSKDILGLRKLEKDLNKALDFKINIKEDRIKKFKKKNRHIKNQIPTQNNKLFTKENEEAIKKGVKYAKDTLVIFHKLATRNKIPNDLHEAIKMKERLIQQESDHEALVKTKEEIKKIQKQIRDRKIRDLKKKFRVVKK